MNDKHMGSRETIEVYRHGIIVQPMTKDRIAALRLLAVRLETSEQAGGQSDEIERLPVMWVAADDRATAWPTREALPKNGDLVRLAPRLLHECLNEIERLTGLHE
jgi:hypothetical protein